MIGEEHIEPGIKSMPRAQQAIGQVSSSGDDKNGSELNAIAGIIQWHEIS